MIKVYLSINNNEEVLLLPVSPETYKVSSPWGNKKESGLRQELNLIGLRGLRTVSVSSFFPARDYPFLLSRDMYGMEYVETIERWRDRRYPIRLVVVDSAGEKSLNMPVTIDTFEWEVEKNEDIRYTLEMTEFAFVETGR